MQLTDLPRDTNAQLSTIRAPLVRLVNSARHSETKRELLRETLKVALVELGDEPERPVEKPTEAPTVTKKAPAKKRATAKVKKDEVVTDSPD